MSDPQMLYVFGRRYWQNTTLMRHTYESAYDVTIVREHDGTWSASFSAAAVVEGKASPEEAIIALGARLKDKYVAHMREAKLEHERRMKGLGL